jgi:O-antigen/teichoic acid export membrane protein
MDLRENEQPYVREEPEWQRLDRNFTELLQELRVAQTGVQILFAFLLSIAFQQRFLALAEYERDIYLATLVSAACAAVLLIAAVHRVLFRRNLKNAIVAVASRLAAGGLFFLALAVVMAVLFVVDVVAGPVAGIVISATIALLVAALWAVLPLRVRLRHTAVDATAPFDPDGASGRSRT